jgi:cytochrome c oxidase cbb3-type subunit 3
MSSGWSLYVIVLILVTLVGCAWLLVANRKTRIGDVKQGDPMGHDFDGIQELNNPLPAWWTWLFVGTLIFAVVYFIAYPGFGSFPGTLGWTSTGQFDEEVARADARYGPLFQGYMEQPIPALVSDERAVEIGSRLFANNCATCHGSDARGGDGYPNLTDQDWLWGGEPETIVQSITHGRVGNMPPLGAAVGGDPAVKDLAQYVLSLSGREHDPAMAERAAPQFATLCAACHGPEGKGNTAMGAPNLTDDIWLHRGKVEDIEYQITNGRFNQMPAHGAIIDPAKIHLLAVYVFSLSHGR